MPNPPLKYGININIYKNHLIESISIYIKIHWYFPCGKDFSAPENGNWKSYSRFTGMERELEIAFPFYEKGIKFSKRKGNLMLLFPGMAGNRNNIKRGSHCWIEVPPWLVKPPTPFEDWTCLSLNHFVFTCFKLFHFLLSLNNIVEVVMDTVGQFHIRNVQNLKNACISRPYSRMEISFPGMGN